LGAIPRRRGVLRGGPERRAGAGAPVAVNAARRARRSRARDTSGARPAAPPPG
jgi:hypothetical protein